MSKYTYKLAFGAASGELFVPDKDAVYDWVDGEDSQGFKRKHVKELVITKYYDDGSGTPPNEAIFNTLWEYYFDVDKHRTDIKLTIYKDLVLDFEGIFYITYGDMDVNDGIYTIVPEPDDSYREFLQVIEDDVDVIDEVAGTYTAWYQYNPDQEEFDNGLPTAPTNAVDGSPLPDYASDNGSIWTQKLNPPDGTWVRIKSQYDIDDANITIPSGQKYNDFWYYRVDTLTKNYYYTNCFLFTSVIQDVLDKMLVDTSLSGMTFVSQFFNNATNYVTGEINRLMHTLLQQNSDTKDPDATDKATKGLLSFKKLMDDLYSMFNVRWYIDGTDLIIEHELFFYNGLSITGYKTPCIKLTDEAKYTDAGTQQLYIEDSQRYDGIKSSLIKTESISFLGAETPEFRDDLNYISYDVFKGVVTKKTHSVSTFATDLAKAINTPDDIDDDGFYLFNIQSIPIRTGAVITQPRLFNDSGFAIGNAGFGTKWLLHDYYEYGRQDKSGFLNLTGSIHPSSQYEVLSTVPIYIQKDIVFLLNNADNIDINRYIATYLIKSDGVNYTMNGSIIEIEHDLETDFVTATLGYEL